MWEKCGTYSRRERGQGAVRHVLPQKKEWRGRGGGRGDTIGGGVGEPGTGIKYPNYL